jgi:hypothetical protein
MLSSQVVHQPQSRAAVTIPHEVHPPFDRHELKREVGRHTRCEVAMLLLPALSISPKSYSSAIGEKSCFASLLAIQPAAP